MSSSLAKRPYVYNKNEGLEEKPKKTRETRNVSPASQRWAKMSWYDLTMELLRYNISYSDSQAMAYNNTLPEDFGIIQTVTRRKRRARCRG